MSEQRVVSDWHALDRAIAGAVVRPESPDYERLRRPAIGRFDGIRPEAVVRCASPEDVAETIAFARRARLPPAVRSGGHCFAGRSSSEGIVIDVSPMDTVSVAGARATIGAGSPWGGAYTRVPAAATAFAHRDARFLLKHAVVVDPGAPDSERAAARDWLARSWQLTHPFGTGGVYPNFPEPELDEWGSEYHAGNRERLLDVKRRYDPDDVFGAASR